MAETQLWASATVSTRTGKVLDFWHQDSEAEARADVQLMNRHVAEVFKDRTPTIQYRVARVIIEPEEDE